MPTYSCFLKPSKMHIGHVKTKRPGFRKEAGHLKIAPMTNSQCSNGRSNTNGPRTNDLELPGARQAEVDIVEIVVVDTEPIRAETTNNHRITNMLFLAT